MQEIKPYEALRSKKAGVVGTLESYCNTFKYNAICVKGLEMTEMT